MNRSTMLHIIGLLAIAALIGFAWMCDWFSQQFPMGDGPLPRLVRAAYSGDVDEMQMYLSKGDDINVVDSNQRNALWWALVREQYGAAEFLVGRGINLESRSNNGLTVLEYCRTTGLMKQATWLSKRVEQKKKIKMDGQKAGIRLRIDTSTIGRNPEHGRVSQMPVARFFRVGFACR